MTLQTLKRIVREAAGDPIYVSSQSGLGMGLLKQALRDAGLIASSDYNLNQSRAGAIARLIVFDRLDARKAERALERAGFKTKLISRNGRGGALEVEVQLASDMPAELGALQLPSIPDLEDVSTDRQKKNGTVALLDTQTGDVYGIFSNGYVRITYPGTNVVGAPYFRTAVIGSPGLTRDEQIAIVTKRVQLRRSKKAAGKL